MTADGRYRGAAAPLYGAVSVLLLLTAVVVAVHALGRAPRFPGEPDLRGLAWSVVAGALLGALGWGLAAARAWRRGPGDPAPWRSARFWLRGLAAVLFAYLLAPLLGATDQRYSVATLLGLGAAWLGALAWRWPAAGRAPGPRWRATDLLLANLVLAVLLLEGGLRIWAAAAPSPWTVDVDGTASRLIDAYRLRPEIPGQYQVNALGFHDTEFERDKPAGTLRIAALGDSFGVGVVPYQANVLTRLETRLRTAVDGYRTEVYNFSVACGSTATYLALLSTEVRRYDPDLVLVLVYAGNDFEVRRARLLDVNRLVINRVAHRLWAQLKASAAEERSVPASGSGVWMTPSYPREVYAAIVERRFAHIAAPGLADRAAGALVDLERIVEQAGVPVVLAVAPDELQVVPELTAELLTPARRAAGYALLQPQRLLADFVRARGLLAVDLRPALLAAEAAGQRTYVPRNTHWNEAGNAVAAEVLAEALVPVLEEIAAGR